MKILDGKCRRCKTPSRGTHPDALCELCKVIYKQERSKALSDIVKRRSYERIS